MLEKSYKDKDDGTKELEIEDLEIFENVAYILALHADTSTPASIDEWLDQFEMFSIYEVLPEILELWGRNGDLIQLGNRYQNLDITYHCGIVKNLRTNFDAFNAKLLSEPGYHRLEDSYHLEYFRIAVFESALDPDVKKRALAGEVDIKFNCKPQLFLKSGEIEQTVMDGGYI